MTALLARCLLPARGIPWGGYPARKGLWVVFLAADKANGPDVSDVGGHSGRIARRCLGGRV